MWFCVESSLTLGWWELFLMEMPFIYFQKCSEKKKWTLVWAKSCLFHLQETAQTVGGSWQSCGSRLPISMMAKEKLYLPDICVRYKYLPCHSHPCAPLSNPIHHSHIIHPSIFPFLANPQPRSGLLLAFVALSCLYEVEVTIPASLKKAKLLT